MNRAELIERLTGMDTALTALDAGVTKIGTETMALQSEIAALREALEEGTITPEVEAALAAIETRAQSMAANVTSVDNLVEDKAPPA